MKKTAIVSLFYRNNNYGAQLQAFALQRYLSNQNFDCEQLTFDFQEHSKCYWFIQNIKQSSGKEKVNAIIILIKNIVKQVLMPVTLYKIKKRKKQFEDFSKKVPHSLKIYNESNIKESVSDYDTFICGSDCIWLDCSYTDTFTLAFVPEEKRKISYAASLGSEHLPEHWEEKYLDNVSKLHAVSVREKSIADDLQKLLPEKKIYTVADPTLLLTAEQWSKYIPDERINGKYVFIYILSEDENQQNEAIRFCKNNSITSLTFPNIHGFIHFDQKKYGDIKNYSADPFDFVNLIKNADVVITDSFHAVVFSILFHKPFYALKRDTDKMFVGRVENLLNDTGLLSQMKTTEEFKCISDIPVIDFTKADEAIKEKRNYSIEFLKENLE